MSGSDTPSELLDDDDDMYDDDDVRKKTINRLWQIHSRRDCSVRQSGHTLKVVSKKETTRR